MLETVESTGFEAISTEVKKITYLVDRGERLAVESVLLYKIAERGVPGRMRV